MDKNYSKKIRIQAQKMLTDFRIIKEVLYKNVDEYMIFSDTLSYTEEDLFKVLPNNKASRFLLVISSMIKMQAYTDYYKERKYNKIINDKDINILSYEEYIELMGSNIIDPVLFKPIEEFNGLSAYNKILYTKSLNKEEHEYLMKYNPFYEEEKNMYDIDINLEFLLRQLKKWNKDFDNQKSYNAASDFIIRLNKIDKESADKLISEIYEKLSLDNGFNNNYNLSKDEVVLLVKQYYESLPIENEKKLSLKNEDNKGKKDE